MPDILRLTDGEYTPVKDFSAMPAWVGDYPGFVEQYGDRVYERDGQRFFITPGTNGDGAYKVQPLPEHDPFDDARVITTTGGKTLTRAAPEAAPKWLAENADFMREYAKQLYADDAGGLYFLSDDQLTPVGENPFNAKALELESMGTVEEHGNAFMQGLLDIAAAVPQAIALARMQGEAAIPHGSKLSDAEAAKPGASERHEAAMVKRAQTLINQLDRLDDDYLFRVGKDVDAYIKDKFPVREFGFSEDFAKMLGQTTGFMATAGVGGIAGKAATGAAGAGAFMASSSAMYAVGSSHGFQEALNEGMSFEDAIGHAVAAGAIEAGTEQLALMRMFKLFEKALGAENAKGILTRIIDSTSVNALQEVAAEVLNDLALAARGADLAAGDTAEGAAYAGALGASVGLTIQGLVELVAGVRRRIRRGDGEEVGGETAEERVVRATGRARLSELEGRALVRDGVRGTVAEGEDDGRPAYVWRAAGSEGGRGDEVLSADDAIADNWGIAEDDAVSEQGEENPDRLGKSRDESGDGGIVPEGQPKEVPSDERRNGRKADTRSARQVLPRQEGRKAARGQRQQVLPEGEVQLKSQPAAGAETPPSWTTETLPDGQGKTQDRRPHGADTQNRTEESDETGRVRKAQAAKEAQAQKQGRTPALEVPPSPVKPPAGITAEEIQPRRARGSAESIRQMRMIAAKPRPERVFASVNMAGDGAPVAFGEQPPEHVGAEVELVADKTADKVAARYAVVEAATLIPSYDTDGKRSEDWPGVGAGRMVVAHNGRTAGLRGAYEQGNAADYKRYLVENAEQVGLDAATVEAMEQPILIRHVAKPDDFKTVARESNKAIGLQVGEYEQALTDAKIIRDVPEIDAATGLKAGTHQGFIRRILGQVAPGEYTTDKGEITNEGVSRVVSAILAKAYQSPEIVEFAVADPAASRYVIGGLMRAAVKMARLPDNDSLGVRGVITEAVGYFNEARERGFTIEDYTRQGEMFEKPAISPAAMKLASTFQVGSRIQSGAKIGEKLIGIADQALRHERSRTSEQLVAAPDITIDQVVDQAIEFGAAAASVDMFEGARREDEARQRERVREVGGMTTGDVVARLKEEFGETGIVSLIGAGQLEVVATDADLPEGARGARAKGVAEDRRRAYLVASRLTPDEVRGAFLHELGAHIGMYHLLGRTKFDALVSEVQSKHGAKWDAAALTALEAATGLRVDKIDEVDREAMAKIPAEEKMAYFVEQNADLGVVKRIMAMIAKLLRKWGLIGITEAELVSLATQAAFTEVEQQGAGEVQFSKRPGAAQLRTTAQLGAEIDKGRAQVSPAFVRQLMKRASVPEIERELVEEVLRGKEGKVDAAGLYDEIEMAAHQDWLTETVSQGERAAYIAVTAPTTRVFPKEGYAVARFINPSWAVEAGQKGRPAMAAAVREQFFGLGQGKSWQHFRDESLPHRASWLYGYLRYFISADGKQIRVDEIQSDVADEGKWWHHQEYHKRNWYKRLLREFVAARQQEGASRFWLPTPLTAAMVEGYVRRPSIHQRRVPPGTFTEWHNLPALVVTMDGNSHNVVRWAFKKISRARFRAALLTTPKEYRAETLAELKQYGSANLSSGLGKALGIPEAYWADVGDFFFAAVAREDGRLPKSPLDIQRNNRGGADNNYIKVKAGDIVITSDYALDHVMRIRDEQPPNLDDLQPHQKTVLNFYRTAVPKYAKRLMGAPKRVKDANELEWDVYTPKEVDHFMYSKQLDGATAITGERPPEPHLRVEPALRKELAAGRKEISEAHLRKLMQKAGSPKIEMEMVGDIVAVIPRSGGKMDLELLARSVMEEISQGDLYLQTEGGGEQFREITAPDDKEFGDRGYRETLFTFRAQDAVDEWKRRFFGESELEDPYVIGNRTLGQLRQIANEHWETQSYDDLVYGWIRFNISSDETKVRLQELQSDFFQDRDGHIAKALNKAKAEAPKARLNPVERIWEQSQQNWYKRVLRQAVNEWIGNGVSTLRVPTRETVAEIEGYLSTTAAREAAQVLADMRGKQTGDMGAFHGDPVLVVDSEPAEAPEGGKEWWAAPRVQTGLDQSEAETWVERTQRVFRDERRRLGLKISEWANAPPAQLLQDRLQKAGKMRITPTVVNTPADEVAFWIVRVNEAGELIDVDKSTVAGRTVRTRFRPGDLVLVSERHMQLISAHGAGAIEDLSDSQKTVVDFYANQVARYLTKIVGAPKEITDDNGLTWNEFDLEAAAVPNYIFSKAHQQFEQVAGKALDRDASLLPHRGGTREGWLRGIRTWFRKLDTSAREHAYHFANTDMLMAMMHAAGLSNIAVEKLLPATDATKAKFAQFQHLLAPVVRQAEHFVRAQPRQAQLLAQVMRDSTLSGLYADRPWKDQVADPGLFSKADYVDLRKKWDALSPQARRVYDLFHRESANLLKQYHRELEARIKRMHQSEAISTDQRKALVDQLHAWFDKTVKGPYFALPFFGDYFVVSAYQGQQYNHAYQSVADRDEARAELEAMGHEILITGAPSFAEGKRDAQAGTSEYMRKVVDFLDANLAGAEHLKDEIYQLYLTTLPEGSIRKELFSHRVGRLGASEDIVRNFKTRAVQMANLVAKISHEDAIREHLDDLRTAHKLATDKLFEAKFARVKMTADRRGAIRADAKRMARDPDAAHRYISQLAGRLEVIYELRDANWASYALRFGFFMLLSKPITWAQNLTQTLLWSANHVGANLGYANAAREYARATRDFLSVQKDEYPELNHRYLSVLPRLKTRGEKQALARLWASHLFQSTQTAILRGETEQNYRAASDELATHGFSVVERWNRESTMMMAYRAWMRKHDPAGLEDAKAPANEEALEFALETVRWTHIDYALANRPAYMRQSNLLRIVTQYWMYWTSMLQYLNLLRMRALTKAPDAVKSAARKELIAGSIIGLAMSGVKGFLPIYIAAAGVSAVYNALVPPDEEEDMLAAMDEAIVRAYGAEAGAVAMRGVIDFILPVSLSERVSSAGLVPFWLQTPLEADPSTDVRRMATRIAEQMAGATVGIALGAAQGIDYLKEGKTLRGLEKLTPGIIAGPVRAARIATDEGRLKTPYGGEMSERQYDFWDYVATVLGGYPPWVHRTFDQKGRALQKENAVMRYRRSLLDKYAAPAVDDPGDLYRTWVEADDVQAFNRRHPEQRITMETLRRSVKSRRAARKQHLLGRRFLTPEGRGVPDFAPPP